MKKRLLWCAALCVAGAWFPALTWAGDGVEASAGLDVTSNYIWRGQDLGGAAFQPTLGIAYKGLSLTGWGSYGFTDRDDTKELDFTLAYEWRGLTVGLTDYYCTAGTENCPGNYFTYKKHRTGHVWEANVGYAWDFLSVNWFTNIGGADGERNGGHRAYSSYLELSAPFRLAGLDWEATVGVVPYSTSYYAEADNFTVTCVGLKASYAFKLANRFDLPLYVAAAANPSDKKIYLTAGVSILINNH